MRTGAAAFQLMLKLNLLPHRRWQQQQRQQRLYQLLCVALAAGAMTVLLADRLLNRQLAQQRSQARLQQDEHNKLDAQLHQLADVQRQLLGLEKQKQHIDALREQQNQTVQLLQTLARATPQEVQLRTFKQQATHLTLSGTAPAHRDIMQLLANLHRAGGIFGPAELQETRAVRDGSHDFVITAEPSAEPPADHSMDKNRQ
jgi:type IV pilus assembly protein PilN